MGFDGEHCTYDLGEQENNKGNIKGGSSNKEPFLQDHSKDPEGSDDAGCEVDGHHFVELKEFNVAWDEDQRNSKEKGIECEVDDDLKYFVNFHDWSYFIIKLYVKMECQIFAWVLSIAWFKLFDILSANYY